MGRQSLHPYLLVTVFQVHSAVMSSLKMFAQVLFVCVCFVVASSSAQSTIDEDNEVDEDLVNSPIIYQNIMDRLE